MAQPPDIAAEPLPAAFDNETCCQLLGGISPATLRRMWERGLIARVEGSRRILITRESLERLTRIPKNQWRPREY